MDDMEAMVKEEEIKDVVKEALQSVKATIAEVAPQMTKADVDMVLKAIKDLTCLV